MKQNEIQKLFKDILKALDGDWLLVGGALLAVLGIGERETLDIDLVPLHEVSNRDQLKIMDAAVKNGLPPEVINFSAEYFIKKTKGWEKEILLLAKSPKARVFRPTKKLFRELKSARGTETDLIDIRLYEEKADG